MLILMFLYECGDRFDTSFYTRSIESARRANENRKKKIIIIDGGTVVNDSGLATSGEESSDSEFEGLSTIYEEDSYNFPAITTNIRFDNRNNVARVKSKFEKALAELEAIATSRKQIQKSGNTIAPNFSREDVKILLQMFREGNVYNNNLNNIVKDSVEKELLKEAPNLNNVIRAINKSKKTHNNSSINYDSNSGGYSSIVIKGSLNSVRNNDSLENLEFVTLYEEDGYDYPIMRANGPSEGVSYMFMEGQSKFKKALAELEAIATSKKQVQKSENTIAPNFSREDVKILLQMFREGNVYNNNLNKIVKDRVEKELLKEAPNLNNVIRTINKAKNTSYKKESSSYDPNSGGYSSIDIRGPLNSALTNEGEALENLESVTLYEEDGYDFPVMTADGSYDGSYEFIEGMGPLNSALINGKEALENLEFVTPYEEDDYDFPIMTANGSYEGAGSMFMTGKGLSDIKKALRELEAIATSKKQIQKSGNTIAPNFSKEELKMLLQMFREGNIYNNNLNEIVKNRVEEELSKDTPSLNNIIRAINKTKNTSYKKESSSNDPNSEGYSSIDIRGPLNRVSKSEREALENLESVILYKEDNYNFPVMTANGPSEGTRSVFISEKSKFEKALRELEAIATSKKQIQKSGNTIAPNFSREDVITLLRMFIEGNVYNNNLNEMVKKSVDEELSKIAPDLNNIIRVINKNKK